MEGFTKEEVDLTLQAVDDAYTEQVKLLYIVAFSKAAPDNVAAVVATMREGLTIASLLRRELKALVKEKVTPCV